MSKIVDKLPLGRLLGEGSYGKVYQIKGKPLAIKYIQSSFRNGLRELGELNNLKRFDHPNILKCAGFTVDKFQLGIVLPLATSDMSKIPKGTGIDTITEWFYQMISSLHFLHKNNFYHCDIKPANILLIDGQAVLADLGLVGKKEIDTENVCQSIMSPQLLFRRVKKYRGKHTDIFNKPSNEYQDDIWALGVTFCLMIPGVTTEYFETFRTANLFVDNRQRELLNINVPDIFMPLILTLLEPLPEKRSLNLISLLGLDIFKGQGKHNLIDGIMVDVHNPIPIIFSNDVDKERVKSELLLLNSTIMSTLVSGGIPVKGDLNIQACDLFYRTYEFFKDKIKSPEDQIKWIRTIIIITLKINNKSNLIFFPVTDEMCKCERQIVELTNGHLSRLCVSDFIEPDKYQTFIEWLSENPERYEQCSLSKLTQIINSM